MRRIVGAALLSLGAVLVYAGFQTYSGWVFMLAGLLLVGVGLTLALSARPRRRS